MTAAFGGAVLAAGLSGTLLANSARWVGYLGVGAAVAALAALVFALPLLHAVVWSRPGLLVTAPLGALCAPAAANGLGSASAPFIGGALIAVWVAVVALLLGRDAREFFATAATPVPAAEA